uniref:Uncharacterized protein n=1 Tax=Glossina pallidipes TaxID=7398 RepID=A0A1B0AA82_GLOPL
MKEEIARLKKESEELKRENYAEANQPEKEGVQICLFLFKLLMNQPKPNADKPLLRCVPKSVVLGKYLQQISAYMAVIIFLSITTTFVDNSLLNVQCKPPKLLTENKSMPISESVVPKEIDLMSRIPIIFITLWIIFSLPERPARLSATTMLATTAAGAEYSILQCNGQVENSTDWGHIIRFFKQFAASLIGTNVTCAYQDFATKQLIPSLVSFAMSNFPISRKCPVIPKQRTEANNLSSDSEFKTKSTPLPLVSRIIIRSNEVSREFPIVGKTDSSMNSYTSGEEGRSISVIRPVTTKAPDSVICGGKSELLAYVWKMKSNVLTYFKIASTIERSPLDLVFMFSYFVTNQSSLWSHRIKELMPAVPRETGNSILGYKFAVGNTTPLANNLKRPSAKAEISDFISVKLILGAIFPVSNAKQAFANEETPDAGSAWPIFDLTEPTNRANCNVTNGCKHKFAPPTIAASISPLRKAVNALSKAYIELEQAVSNKNEGPSKPKLYEMRFGNMARLQPVMPKPPDETFS